MNEEIKTEWVKRLREPDRKQTTGTLKVINDDGSAAFCCLGVLCEIAAEQGITEEVVPTEEQRAVQSAAPGAVAFKANPRLVADDDSYLEYGILPKQVVSWAGLHDSNVSLTGKDGKYYYLATMNDNGHDFGEIADIIEAHA